MSTKKKPARKPAKRAKPKAQELSKAEAFYVESHYGQKDAKALAADLGVPVAAVLAYQEKLEEAGFKKKDPPDPVQQAGFAVKNGTVSMTPAGSETGDLFRQQEAKPRNEEFFKRRGGGIHVIDPERPVR